MGDGSENAERRSGVTLEATGRKVECALGGSESRNREISYHPPQAEIRDVHGSAVLEVRG